jgi:hypothetical protein
MEMLALLLIVPLIWPFVAKALWNNDITLGEMAINIAVGVLIVVAGYYGGKYSMTADQEVLSGQLVSKSRDKVSCSHSYRCNCVTTYRTDSKGVTTSSETCQTCYDHPYDVNWNLDTTLGEIRVDRVNRQGTDEPPRWTRAAMGDPVAQTHGFTNYIKGAPNSLFNALVEKQALARYHQTVPEYPLNVFDYHYLNRVLATGVNVPDLAAWNQELALRLRSLGPSKQVNLVVVFTKESSPAYADALRVKWLGGKKNDVIVVLGTPAYPKLEWARVISWTDKELFKVQLRDELQALKEVERTVVFDILERNVKATFVRKPMKDFEYLENEIQPPGWLLAVLFVLSTISSVGASVFFRRNQTL